MILLFNVLLHCMLLLHSSASSSNSSSRNNNKFHHRFHHHQQQQRQRQYSAFVSSKQKSAIKHHNQHQHNRIQYPTHNPTKQCSSSLLSLFQSPTFKSSTTLLHATSSEELKSNSNQHVTTTRKKTMKKITTSSSSSSSGNSSKSSKSSSSSNNNDTQDVKQKEGQSKIIKDDKENDDIPSSSSSTTTTKSIPSFRGIDRLSRAIAKESAERDDFINNNNTNQQERLQQQQSSKSSSTTSATTIAYVNNNNHNNNDNKEENSVRSLTQLTKVIDNQLYASGPRGTRGDFPTLNGVITNARDNMISLLGFNQVKGDWKDHSSKSTYNVAIVFGKDLVRDQITVEYASRIRTLARLFKDEPEFRPSLVCFCGGIADGNHVSNADAGYIFFRHMCEAQGIDLDGVGIFIDNASRDDEDTIYTVTEKVKIDYVPKWLELSPTTNSLSQKVLNVHFTMVSTEYHLCNINDIHHRSPQQSLLTAMEDMGDYFKGSSLSTSSNSSSQRSSTSTSRNRETIFNDYSNNFYDNDYDVYSYGTPSSSGSSNPMQKPIIRGQVKTSWSFQYATYPYIYAKDDATVFLGKCYLLSEELTPLLVNMEGVVNQIEFFQRDNYLMLTSIRRSLVNHIEDLYKNPSIKKALSRSQNLNGYKTYEGGKTVIGILEGALLSLGRCVDLVKPAGLHLGSVSKTEWKRTLGSFEHSMSEIRDHCDPDRPLRPSEWGKLVDDEGVTLES